MSILDRLNTVCEQGAVVPPELLRDTIDRLEQLEADLAEAIALALIDEADWTQDHSSALNALVELRGASDDKLDGGRDG